MLGRCRCEEVRNGFIKVREGVWIREGEACSQGSQVAVVMEQYLTLGEVSVGISLEEVRNLKANDLELPVRDGHMMGVLGLYTGRGHRMDRRFGRRNAPHGAPRERYG